MRMGHHREDLHIMRHFLFAVSSAVSLLLCIAILILWATSFKAENGIWFTREKSSWDFISADGAARYCYTEDWDDLPQMADEAPQLQAHCASGKLLGDADTLIEDNARSDGWTALGFV